jgi:hypothetical protein
MSVHIYAFVSLQGNGKFCSQFYLITLGFSIRNCGKDSVLRRVETVIVHPGICPPFGIWSMMVFFPPGASYEI